MLEIVFSQSAAGTLRFSRGYGRGPFRPESLGFVAAGEDGDEMRRLTQQERRRWENAVPMEVEPADVFCFDLALDYGDIAGETRLSALRALASFDPPERVDGLREAWQKTVQDLDQVCRRAAAGEPVRIYSGSQPAEACGLCWLLSRLHEAAAVGPVFLVTLPALDCGPDGPVSFRSWAEVNPGDWGRLVQNQRQLDPSALTAAALEWQQLRQENAPLRILLNGRILGVSEDFYDCFIRNVLDTMPEEFPEPRLIGEVMGRYQLGLSDGFVALRIQEMIASGELTVVPGTAENYWSYRRSLHKMTAEEPDREFFDLFQGEPDEFTPDYREYESENYSMDDFLSATGAPDDDFFF